MLMADQNNVFAQRTGMTAPQAPMAGAGGPVASPIMAGGFRPPGMPSGMPMGMPQGSAGNPIMAQPGVPQMPGQMSSAMPQAMSGQMPQLGGIGPNMDPNTLNMLRARMMGTMQ